jgi:hypothetical protein
MAGVTKGYPYYRIPASDAQNAYTMAKLNEAYKTMLEI